MCMVMIFIRKTMTIEAPQEGGTGGKQLELGEFWRRPPGKLKMGEIQNLNV